MAKIGIISDLHLEFDDMYGFQRWDFLPEKGVHYVNAGDTHSRLAEMVRWTRRHDEGYMSIVYGNHDYWGRLFPGPGDGQFVTETEEGVRVVGATLWTRIGPLDWVHFQGHMRDYQKIVQCDEYRMQQAHEYDTEWVFNSDHRADVIVTHHSPSWLSIAKPYKGNPFNKFFHSAYEERILDMRHPPKLWVHGHTHEPMDYMIGSTRVVCHPRGYPGETNHAGYAPKIVEI